MAETKKDESDEITVVSTQVVYEQDKAAIDVQISTAKAYPRNITKATNNALAIVTMDRDTAQTCTYSVPRGGKPITGPSVHLAKILAQVWGNLRIEAKVVSIDEKQVTSEAVCFDLENNLAIKTQVKRSIIDRNKKRYSEDLVTVTGNAANSIALRNAVLSVIPRSIVDKVYNEAKAMITGDVSNDTKLIAKRKQVVDALKDTYGVTEQEIFAAVGKAAITHLTSDDLVILIGVGTAIKDGDTTVEEAFKGKSTSKDEGVTLDQLKELLDSVVDELNAGEFRDAKRIMGYDEKTQTYLAEKSEPQSFAKLHKLFQSKVKAN